MQQAARTTQASPDAVLLHAALHQAARGGWQEPRPGAFSTVSEHEA